MINEKPKQKKKKKRGTEFSSDETELRKMTRHFELLNRRFL